MTRWSRHMLGWLIGAFRSRQDLILENLALRQRLLALHAKKPRPRLRVFDKLFWVGLRKLWSGWKKSLILVTPEAVARWHRKGFRLYWTWLSRTPRTAGRKPSSKELRDLIFRMVAENPTWVVSRRREIVMHECKRTFDEASKISRRHQNQGLGRILG